MPVDFSICRGARIRIMSEIKTEIIIEASAEKVWNILMDFERYPDWNPFIKSISGKPQVGEKLKVFIQPPGGNGMNFAPVVLAAQENREFRWLGKVLVSGIFDGEHIFIIEPVGDSKIRFIHAEKFKGVLVFLLSGTLKNAAKGFELMNKSLKERAENKGK